MKKSKAKREAHLPLISSLAAILLLTGCAGKLVCEWQSQSEQFERVLEKYIGESNAIPKENE